MTIDTEMAARGLSFISVTPVEIQGRVWLCVGFEENGQALGDHPHLAMIYGERDWLSEPDLRVTLGTGMAVPNDTYVRIHSECILGDSFGSSMCDCGEQLRLAMDEMVRQGEGVIVYLRQEGRGIGLRAKLDCLALQYGYKGGELTTHRHSSDEANLAMGFLVDHRDYMAAGNLLAALNLTSVKMITGNPKKVADIEAAGVRVTKALDMWQSKPSARAAHELAEKIARGYTYNRTGLNGHG